MRGKATLVTVIRSVGGITPAYAGKRAFSGRIRKAA